MVMLFGIQRMLRGHEASVMVPATSSHRLAIAMACTVPMWLVTRRRLRKCASERPGSSTSKTGRIERK